VTGVQTCALPISQFRQFAFRHTTIELATAVKPRLLQHLVQIFPNENVFYYLDPDIDVHGRFDEASEQLRSADILLTPHDLDGVMNPREVLETVLPHLKCGVFNLGFLGLKRSDTVDRFLHWWAHMVSLFCYVDYARGLFVDQKWVDMACGIFPISVLREPGYNVARWNISQRPIVAVDGGHVVCGRPLRFIHFSQIDIGKDQLSFRRHAPLGTEPIHGLRRAYQRRTRDLRAELGTGDAWSYDYFDSGERIALEARIVCRNRPQILDTGVDPFAESNEFFFTR